jgi:hypothetical protein
VRASNFLFGFGMAGRTGTRDVAQAIAQKYS